MTLWVAPNGFGLLPPILGQGSASGLAFGAVAAWAFFICRSVGVLAIKTREAFFARRHHAFFVEKGPFVSPDVPGFI
jgi:hypothetical protein